MIKKYMNFCAAIIMGAVILSSCGYTDEGYPIESPNDLSSLVESLKTRVIEETYNINAGETSSITTKNGSIVTFYPSSFVTTDGSIITSGTIMITIKDLVSKDAIIFQNSTTMTDAKNLLESGGQLEITAFNESLEVVQAMDYDILFNAEYTPLALSKNMGLFRGLQDETGMVSWRDEPLVADTVKASSDSMGSFYSFVDVDSLGWINLDRFLDEGIHNVKIDVNSTLFDATNTLVFYVFEDIMSIGTMSGFNPVTHEFNNVGYGFPNDHRVKFLLFSKLGDQVYYALTDVYTMDGDQEISVDMLETTEAELADIISSL